MGQPFLPPGYYIDAVSDPDVLFLCRPDGSRAAIFSASGATQEAIEGTAWEDYRKEDY